MQEVAEFANLAAGVDPASGEPFGRVEDLLFAGIQSVPDPAEGLLGVIDGRVALTASTDVPVRLEDHRALVDAVAALDPTEPPALASVSSTVAGRSTTIVFVAVPVRVASSGRVDTPAVSEPTSTPQPTGSTGPADQGSGLAGTADAQPGESGFFVIGYDREVDRADLDRSYQTYALVALAALVLIGLIGWLVADRLLRPVRLLRETTQRISETDLSGRIPVSGTDDLSELARTVNAMLDRLELAVRTQRDVLDDAGHELRTPITIVRGHLEVMDGGDPADVAETRMLALDELDRMHRLVDEIVLLAKAKRPDFVRLRPTELGALVDDVLDKARPLATRRWMLDARADAVVEVDPQRITQAMIQLVANAVKFTDDGQTIALGSQVRGDTVELWVRDSGIGIDQADLDRIFERFARAGSGRGVEGSGLGLSIVEAIAAAHHGTVDVDSQLGRGSVFTLRVPLRRPPTPLPAEPDTGAGTEAVADTGAGETTEQSGQQTSRSTPEDQEVPR